MALFNKGLLWIVLLIASASAAAEQQHATDVSVLYGVWNSDDFDSTEDDVQPLSTQSGDAYALAVNHFQRFKGDDRILYEFWFSQASTEVDIPLSESIPATRVDMDVTYYHAGGIIEFSPQPHQLTPYFGGTLGVTHLRADNYSSETDFSMSVNGGVRWLSKSGLGIRLDARLFATFVDSSAEILCSGGCIARFQSDVWWQYQLGIGVMWAF